MEKNIRTIENTTLEQADWDRSDYGPCDPHYIAIDDLGHFKCTGCLAGCDKKVVIDALKELRGEFWVEEWEALKRIKKLVNLGKWGALDMVYCIYRDNKSVIKTDSYFFYEKPI